MAQLMISRSRPIRSDASIQISGAKNASLPEMAACLLAKDVVTLKNVPRITDIEHMIEQLKSYGVQVSRSRDGSTLTLDSRDSRSSPENASAGTKIRGSFVVLGALVARFGQAEVPIPGGCEIAKSGRPVNFHIDALKDMGAKEVRTGNVNCITLKAEGGLRGARIHFPEISVGATENIMMAACLAKGQTIITNAAVEPEVIDLVDMLKEMGADITEDKEGKKITIRGNGEFLSGITHTVIPDRIEAGSYAIYAAIVGGTLLLKMPDPGVGQEILVPVIEKLKAAGVQVTSKPNGLEIKRSGQIKPVHITTGAYPEFPTDLLPQWTTFMTLANGTSRLEDTIYDGRFKHVKYLKKMGAKIEKESGSDSVYYVHGVPKLTGTVEPVQATDLRGGMALILAALAAEGTTVVKNIEHVLRGYENLEEKLKQCGAKIEKVKKTPPGHSGGARR